MAQENSAVNIEIDSVYWTTDMDIEAIPSSDIISDLNALINNSDCVCKTTVFFISH